MIKLIILLVNYLKISYFANKISINDSKTSTFYMTWLKII